MSRPGGGDIVVVDWRGVQHPEPGALRPGVVVEDADLFVGYPMILVVPLTRDARLAHADFSVRLEPTAENGLSTTSWALSHHVNSVAVRKIQVTASRVTEEQLGQIRARIALAVGTPLSGGE